MVQERQTKQNIPRTPRSSIFNSSQANLDLGQLGLAPSSSRVISRPYAFDHTIYVDEILMEPADWRYEIDLIRTAGPDDVFHLHINSGGGSIAVLIALIAAMRASVATFVGYLNYECCSAATVLLLECDQWVITEDCCFMIHNSSTGYGGKSSDLTSYALFNDDHSRNLVVKYYKDFLTEVEIADVLKGVEIWLSGEEVVARLNARQKLREARDAVMAKEENSPEEGLTEEEWPLDIAFQASEAPDNDLESVNLGVGLAQDAISGSFTEEILNTSDIFVTNFGVVVGKNFIFYPHFGCFDVYNAATKSKYTEPDCRLDLDTNTWDFDLDMETSEVKELCDWLGISYGSKASKKTLIAKVKAFVNSLVEIYGTTKKD